MAQCEEFAFGERVVAEGRLDAPTVGSLPRRAARGSHEVVNRGLIQLVTRNQIAESLKENRSSGVFIDGERDQALKWRDHAFLG